MCKTLCIEKDYCVEIYKLTCNYLSNPLGVETPSPLLSWMLYSDERGQRQTAYRIIAASRLDKLNLENADLWDTGKVESDQSIHIKYKGKPLESRQRCFWKVCVWDRKGNESCWSETAFFEMGLLKEEDWKAKWICSEMTDNGGLLPAPAPLFRKPFILNKPVLSARAYICGVGYFELYINGMKTGEEVLSPAFTRYDETVLYNTYDITGALDKGENVLGVILGNGWYNCFTSNVWDFSQAAWRHNPKFILQVHIDFEDGESLMLVSDTSWKASSGPIVFDGLRNGEHYDARIEKTGWNCPGYYDAEWSIAKIVRSPGGILRSSQMTPIKVNGTITPVSFKEAAPGVWVYDLGQNISGWAKIKVKGPAGTEITLKYGEKLKDSGLVDQSNINMYVKSGEFQTDKYILKGEGLEIWEPRFTYHGFQYVEVTGFPGIPAIDSLCAQVVHTAFEEWGSFECSNELLNKIQKCVHWSTLTNYHGVPTDCPHREKNAWTGDAVLSAEQVLMNYNPMTAYTKWMQDFKDIQRPSGQLPGIVPTGGWGFNWGSGPAWDSAILLIPWYMYIYCGDISILERMYEAMKKYVGFMNTMAENYIIDFGLGDWCPPEHGDEKYKCPSAVTDTAYYYIDAEIVSKIAGLLNKSEDQRKYTCLAENIRNAFRGRFLNTETGIVAGECQTSEACALYQGLVNENEKSKVIDKLVEYVEAAKCHIDCGILGAKYLLHSLTEAGRVDLAYEIANQTTYPGWGYWIAQGATTLWETWNGDASRNHHMFSDIGAWFYKGLAGINPDPEEPAFKHIILRPGLVAGLKWVNSGHQSMYGRIEFNWKTNVQGLEIKAVVPVNCRASLYVPQGYSSEFSENGMSNDYLSSIKVCQNEDKQNVLNFGSGVYHFTIKKHC